MGDNVVEDSEERMVRAVISMGHTAHVVQESMDYGMPIQGAHLGFAGLVGVIMTATLRHPEWAQAWLRIAKLESDECYALADEVMEANPLEVSGDEYTRQT